MNKNDGEEWNALIDGDSVYISDRILPRNSGITYTDYGIYCFLIWKVGQVGSPFLDLTLIELKNGTRITRKKMKECLERLAKAGFISLSEEDDIYKFKVHQVKDVGGEL